MRKLINALEYFRRFGLAGFCREIYYRSLDIFYERYFGVETRQNLTKEDLGISVAESVAYSSVPYQHIINSLNKLAIDKKKSTLLDYGCGKGRVLIVGAADQYQKIIGVEMTDIINVAKSNIGLMKHRKTDSVILKQCDAAIYEVPSDVNIIYFFNPFRGSVLEKVVDNIYSSFQSTPREIHIVFFGNSNFEIVVANLNWLTKLSQSTLHLNIPCGIYKTVS